nr:mucin-5B [Equus caballus]
MPAPGMGAPRGCRALAWALAALLLVQKAETQGGEELSWAGAEAAMDGQREAFAQQMIFIPPVTVFPTMSPVNPAHNGRVCSTWGDFHYKTFDGYVFRFPGLCNYVFSAHCGAAYEDFNIQLRRGLAGSKPTITHVVLKTQGLVLEISNGSILINGQQEELPYSRAGLLVEQSSVYVKVNVRLVLTFMWNGEDSALLELDPKYANQTCGLCGDFNGLPAINEFYAHNTRLTPLQFGNLQKLDGPTEQCQDPLPSPADNCTDEEGICRRTLLGLAFAQCHGLVDADVYVAACTQDLCRCPTCPCATFAEYSRQCTHAGGQPQNWRGPDLCPRTCPLNLQHQECGSPCTDTCSNPDHSQLCEDHCVDGCFCPPGTVLDDVSHAGCLPLEQCSCTHSGRTYAPGASFTTSCSSCTCSSGMWQCQDLPCPGTCSVQGGSHISTYDEKLYNVHGDCSYILSKTCADSGFTVLAELRQCGLTDNENCLKTVTLKMTSGGDTVIQIQANGGVFMNSIYTQLPVSAANITIFRPSSFFILVQTGLGLQLQVQLVPLMQVYLRLDPSYRGQMCGLCGNFNQNQADDFRILGGVVEGTAAAFANTWKTQAACPNVKNSFEDPCSLSVENENFAQHWCSLLTDPTGAFSPCHSIVNPAPFHSNCLFDTCNCEKSEACMCAALSSYVWACAAKGVLLHGWRDGVCTKYMSSCPKSQNYTYVVDSCQPTCRSLSQADVTCGIAFVPVDGCTCPSGTFLDDTSTCVPAEACPCYFRGSVVAPGEVVHDDGVVCSCVSGKLSCLGAEEQRSTGCVAPMLYLDCTNASAGTPGAECLRSCHVLDVDCFSTHCVSGCVCPPGLVSDGSGGCVAEEDCPCLHNEATYKPGETIRVDCNTCTCRNRRWECSHQPCLGTCVAYGDGHFITFDGERYSFEGSCEYTLVQDHCGGNGTANGTFRIVTENVPCGTTGVTCSKTIKLFLENYELILHEGTYKVVQRGPGRDLPYRIRYMGIYLTIETRSGMVVSWDRKTSVFIRLRQDYKGRVCGLCGNFDDNAINDFTTRSQSVVGNALEFGNSWKFSPSCPDAPAPKDPCTANPYRKSWAQKQCSIINSATFATCRSQVDSTKYYEACVSDACACNSGGDCECFCTAVAAYAQACRDVGVCVSWRSPDVCPLFCDYYNPHGECEWHYEPCGAPCLRTCRNPSGHCLVDLPGLEGCYPRCPPGRPFFSEDEMECVAQCGCYDEDGNYHEVGARVPAAENCQSCECTPNGIQCIHSLEACRCIYEGKTYGYEEVIYNTTDGLGACLLAICGNNGTIIRSVVECPGTLSTTPFTFTTTAAPPSTTGSAPTLSTVCVQKQCRWSDWYDSGRPEPDMGGGDFETFANLKQRGHQVCPAPVEIECRAQRLPNTPLQELGQKVECDLARGLTCLNSEQSPPLCHNYELRVLCCDYVPCGTSPAPGTSSGPSPSVTAQVSTLKSLPTSTWTTPTRETPLQSTVASTSQTRPTVPATTAQTGSSSSTLAATTCQPKCQWTEWFDEDYPTSEKAGGDIESYDKIRSAGGAVCEQPQDIECEAENFPTVRPEELGQRVHCHPSFGLVCRNQEQPGLFKMCYNYRIRVLCCSNSHCRGPASATTTATTAATATTTTATIATSTTTATNTSTKATTATTAITTTATATTATATSIATSATASTTRIATTASTTTITPASTSTTAMASTGTATTVPPATEPGTWLGSSPEVTTAVPFLSTGSTSRATSSNPSHTDTLLTSATSSPRSPPGSTKPTTPGGATSVLPTRTTLQGTTEGTSQGSTSRPRLPTEAPTSTTRTVSTSPPSTSHTRTSTLRTETPKVTLVPTAVTETTTSQGTTSCQPKCEWTEWFDVDFPTSGVTGGDMETYENIRAAGGRMCAEPQKIECRAENYPEVSLDQIGQVLSCSLEAGLVCRNEDQQGRFNMCFNYNIRVLCCDDRSHCPSTAAPSPSSTATGFPTSEGPGRSTSATTQTRLPSPTTQRTTARQASSTAHLQTSHIGTTTGSPPIRPTSATTLLSSPSQPGSVTSTPTVSSTEACKCAWTRWFDEDYPTPGHAGGDFETYANIRAAGEDICEQPLHLECRAEMWPDVPVQELGQVVQCDVSVGLVCRNRDQSGPIKLCLNYHIRVFCCDYSHCPGTPATTTATPPATSPGLTSLTATGTTARPPTTPSPTSPNTHPTTATSGCQPACHWTEWLDSDWPKPGPYGGDSETYHHILRAGGQLCSEPVAIECQAVLFPEVPFRQLGQVVKCDVDYGLICRNKWQSGGETCLNYHIRVRCCDDYSHCASSAVPATTTLSPRRSTTSAKHGAGSHLECQESGAQPRPRCTSPLQGPPRTTFTSLRTTEVTVPTSETGPSSRTTTHSVPTTQTPFTSLRTTEVTVPTSETGPSSRTTTHSVPTTQAPFTSLRTTKQVTVPTTKTGLSSSTPTELTISTTETGPSSSAPTPSVLTTQTPFTSLWTTEKVTVPTSPTSLMSPVTTEITVPPTETHPSSPATMQRLSIPTTEIVPSSPRTTQRVSISSPSASPGTLPTTTRPAPPSAPPTARIITTPWSPPSGPTSATTLLSSPSQPSSMTHTPTASSTEVCKPQCAWTRWFDEDYPTPGHAGGDFETYANIRAAGEDICEQPLHLECRAEMWPDVPVQELGQVVQCDVSVGLVCRNRDQSGPIKLCLNYHIRVFCCDYSHCPGTPATTTATPPATSPGLTSLTATGTTARPPTTPSPTSPNTHPTTATSGCQPACHWTEWLDSDWPKPGPYGGDSETYHHILRAGGQLCSEPVAIECQAVLFPEVPFRQLGQVVKCDVDYGLICRNKWQSGGETCLNYHIRVRCCDDYSHCASSAVPATTTLSPRPSTTSASTGRQSSGVSRVWSTATTQVYLSSPGTSERVSIPPTETGPSSPRTSERLSIHTSQTGPSSPWTTGRVSISSSSASPRTQTTTATPGLPSAPPSPPLVTSHMWTTAAISSSLPHFSVSTASPSILTTPGPTAFPSPLISTTACLCRAFGQLFSPGDVIYNKTDSAGCQFYAICNQRCDIDRFQGSCPTSSPPETSVTLNSPVPGCDLIDPPRQVNESWTLANCTVARCEGENHIVLLEPKPVANITCVNGHLPVKLWSENERCTYRLECECSCSGWGHSHYKTFDGTSYSFGDNCTHVLMREIRPLYGNLSIYINNYYCGATAATTHCPRALIIHYKSMEIILTTTTGTDGQEQSLILFDQRRVSEVFSKNGVNVSVTGTTMMHIDISAILVSISFDGHIFQARLSYSHFSHNTEGLCGTCTNSQTDDCRRPDGTMAPTCKDMASSWLVPDSSKEGCQAPPPTTSPLPHTPTTPTSPPCAPAPLCKLLLSQVFAECHSLIPPGPFFSTCVSDGCQTSHPNVSCQSLEAYAALCHARGVCSNWRNATAGLCELTCPPTKVYKSCGPVQPEACNSRSQSPVRKGLAEGCFCPDGHILFNSYTDICVPQCPCVGPDGFPKFPGERWVSNCQACVCDEDSVSVQCVPVQCKAQDQPLECGRAGFLTITRPLADNPCCQETLCICNVTTCPQSPLTCGPGLELTLTQREGDCCPTFLCKPKLCTYNGTFYGVGATFPGVTPCHKCACLSVDTGNLTVQCEENTCNTTCPQGFEYSEVAGQCCGECVQTACLTPSGGLVQPNETWVNSPVDNCTEYHCQAENGLLVLTPRPVSCPIVSSCRGVLQKRGCCYSCEEDSCRVRVQRKALRLGDCVSPALVNVPFCEGSCLGVSVYSLEAQAMQHECTCCQEKRAHQEVVTLQCPDGTTIQYTYIHVDACSCTPGCAPSPEAPEDSTPILLL